MSEPDAVPLPRDGQVFFDVRGESRSMRLSWYADSAVAVFSIWQGNRCTGTFRLPFGDLTRMMQTLESGPPGARAGYGDDGHYQAGHYESADSSDAYDYPPGSSEYGPADYDAAGDYRDFPEYGYGPAGYEGAGYDDAGYEASGYSDDGYGGPGASYEDDPGYGYPGYQEPPEPGYEDAAYENAGYPYDGPDGRGPSGYSTSDHRPSGYESPRSYENPSSYTDLGYENPGSYATARGIRAAKTNGALTAPGTFGKTTSGGVTGGAARDARHDADWEAATASYPLP